jgi:hypothetical protein
MSPRDPITNIDPQARISWHIDDAIVRLRLWGTEYTYRLPEPPVALTLGSAATCDVRLRDRAGLLSREHARLIPMPGSSGWEIHDCNSTNGLKVDGTEASRTALHAGAKLQLGGLILVAESLQFIGLRALLCRLVGWAPDRRAEVDEAAQNVRACATQRMPLILLGDRDLSPIAMRLHRLALGPAAPFVRHDGGDARGAIQAALHGTLCVPIRNRATATEIADIVHTVDAVARPRLVLCANSAGEAAAVTIKAGRRAVIVIPPLSTRADELSRLVHETADDLVREMGAPSTGFTMHDLERLQAMEFSSIAELEDTIRRVIAMRTWGVTAGAKRLGLKHSSLLEWARRSGRNFSI